MPPKRDEHETTLYSAADRRQPHRTARRAGTLPEALARNVHEVWAATRIAQGWRFGPERNDARKEHPCLIPYEELPEEERTYDRQTALETLKLIEHLGFEIRKR